MEDLEVILKRFDQPDEITNFAKGKFEKITINNMVLGRATYQPGWKWSECIKPTVGGESCQAGHVGVVISGGMKCIHDDGSELEVGPGDAYYFAPGHDGWVLGEEPCVVYEIVEGGKDFGPWKHAH